MNNQELQTQRENLRLQHINMAISIWQKKKRGIYAVWESERHTPEYCEKQIQYFKKLKS